MPIPNLQRNRQALQPSKTILFIAPVYNYYPMIVPSLLAQTHFHWKLFLVHDGPHDKNQFDMKKFLEIHQDDRIIYHETQQRRQQYGHPIRRDTLEDMKKGILFSDVDFVNITNADNYYAPGFCQLMLKGFSSDEILATYCSHISHSYVTWSLMQMMLRLGSIDICSLVFRKTAACDIGWNSMEHSSDWTFISQMMTKYGTQSFQKVAGCLVTHN